MCIQNNKRKLARYNSSRTQALKEPSSTMHNPILLQSICTKEGEKAGSYTETFRGLWGGKCRNLPSSYTFE